jgi:hypothetical protein
MSLSTNPYQHLLAAAHGDLEALRALALFGEALAADEKSVISLSEGLIFARLAAVRGAAEDTIVLLRMIGTAIDMCEDNPDLRASFEGELLAIVSNLADGGNERAAEALCVFSEVFSPGAAVIAQAAREQMLRAQE